jgi:TorA maturation chaperone TorD
MLNEFLTRNKLFLPELLRERLAQEHLRLFGGLTYGRSPPPPYESVWRGEGKLMGKVTSSVLRTYNEAGMELASGTTEPPDHVGVELSYLSYLCSKEADAHRSCDSTEMARYSRMQYDFLRQHVVRWVPSFCQHIARADTTGFYQGIAILTREFLLADSYGIPEEYEKR